jgi:DNA-binding transcriptional MerR regulator
MKSSGDTRWTIQDLCDEVARALARDYAGARDARTRDIPDLRTIRYYTTLGLLDRPAEMRGRTALYGRRHLVQLVAIKQLQSRGLSLPQIQQRLAGATDAVIAKLAGMDLEKDRAPRGSRPFWKTRPAPFAARSAADDKPVNRDLERPVRPDAVAAYQDVRPLQAVGLTDDVVILLPAPRPIDPAELAALRSAAVPLLRHLRRRQLIPPVPKGERDDQADSADER